MLISNRNFCTNTCNFIRVSWWLCKTSWLCSELSHDSIPNGDKVSRNRHPYHIFETTNVVVLGFTLLANVCYRGSKTNLPCVRVFHVKTFSISVIYIVKLWKYLCYVTAKWSRVFRKVLHIIELDFFQWKNICLKKIHLDLVYIWTDFR